MTGCAWPVRSARPTEAMWFPAGGQTLSSRAFPARRSRLGGGAVARGHRQTGANPFPHPGSSRGAVGRCRRFHRRGPGRLGGAAVGLGATGGADRSAVRRRTAVDRADQSACRTAAADQKPQSAGSRRSVRHGAVRGHRRTGDHRYHPVLAAGVVGRRRRRRRRPVVGRGRRRLIERWNALLEWSQILLRALMFRLAVHALHPRSTAEAFPGIGPHSGAGAIDTLTLAECGLDARLRPSLNPRPKK